MLNPERQPDKPSPEDIAGGLYDPYKRNGALWLPKDLEFRFENKREEDSPEEHDDKLSEDQDRNQELNLESEEENDVVQLAKDIEQVSSDIEILHSREIKLLGIDPKDCLGNYGKPHVMDYKDQADRIERIGKLSEADKSACDEISAEVIKLFGEQEDLRTKIEPLQALEISQCSSFKELYEVLDKIGPVVEKKQPSSSIFRMEEAHPSDYSVETIEKMRKDYKGQLKKPTDHFFEQLTRAGGLRNKVIELLTQEENPDDAKLPENETENNELPKITNKQGEKQQRVDTTPEKLDGENLDTKQPSTTPTEKTTKQVGKREKVNKEEKLLDIEIPLFDPKEHFAIFTESDFDPDKPFKEQSEGRRTMAQLLHAMSRKGYGKRALDSKETIRETDNKLADAIEEFGDQENEILLNYYQELIQSIKDQGGDLESPKTYTLIREAMIGAKRELERHLIASYGGKIYQEKRSNWWDILKNYADSHNIAEKKTLGDASDLVAMNKGHIGDTEATVNKLETEDIIKRINAHVGRSIKMSIGRQWLNGKNNPGYISPDDKRYDRCLTYNILLDEYFQRMAEKIRGENAPASEEELVEEILKVQKPRIETLGEDAKQKRIKNLRNKLIIGASTAILGSLLIFSYSEVAKAHFDKDTSVKIENAINQKGGGAGIEQPSSKLGEELTTVDADTNIDNEKLPTTTIEETAGEQEKIEQEVTEESKVEKEDTNKGNIIVVDMGDEELHLNPETQKVTFVAKNLNYNLEDSRIDEQKQEFHTLLSKIQVLTAGVEDNYVSKTVKINSLKKLLTTWKSLDSNTQEKFNKYVHESGGYGSLAKSMFPNEDIDQYTQRMIQKLQ